MQESLTPSALEEPRVWLGSSMSSCLLREMLFPQQTYVWHIKAAGRPAKTRSMNCIEAMLIPTSKILNKRPDF